jgi:hypothetical protein
MESDYQAQRSRLAEALKPAHATIDTAELVLKRSAQTRSEVFVLLKELEHMQIVFMIIEGQTRGATNRAGIPEVEAHIRCLRNIASLFSETFSGAPRRAPVEQDLAGAATQFNLLRNTGTGEMVLTERQRLRALSMSVPVVGAEDIVGHERELRSLQTNIDQLEAELQNLQVTTMLTLRLPDELAQVIANFGVAMNPEPAAPSLPAAADSAAAPEASQPAAASSETE